MVLSTSNSIGRSNVSFLGDALQFMTFFTIVDAINVFSNCSDYAISILHLLLTVWGIRSYNL